MNIHLPVIWGSLGYQGFDSYPGMLGEGAHANNNLQPMTTYEPHALERKNIDIFVSFCTVHTYNEGYAYVPVEHGRTKCILQLSAVHLLDNWLSRRLIFLALVLKTNAYIGCRRHPLRSEASRDSHWILPQKKTTTLGTLSCRSSQTRCVAVSYRFANQGSFSQDVRIPVTIFFLIVSSEICTGRWGDRITDLDKQW